jgi:caffeoyl-CoA O-methyltransferase
MTDPTLEDLWLEVDRYIETLFVPRDRSLEEALADSARAGLPEIHVSPTQGRLLYLLARIAGARRILEIGLLGGYSAIWLARALPENGRLVSLEIDAGHAAVARKNLDRAGLLSRTEIRVGPALEVLAAMARAGEPSFDLVFIDADKESYPAYLDASLKLVHSGSLIVADNVIRRGAVARPAGEDRALQAIQEFNRKLAGNPALEATLVPLMRQHLDGISLARVS